MSDEKVEVVGIVVVVVVVPVVVVVGIVVILSVVVLVVVMVVGVNVVRRVDRVVAVLVVRLGSEKVVVDGVVVDGVVQVVVDVEVGVVTASAIDLAVVLITRPRAATVELVGPMVVVLAAVRGASRSCAISRGSVPNIAPAFRRECCLMLSANLRRHPCYHRTATPSGCANVFGNARFVSFMTIDSFNESRSPRIPARN